MGKVKSAVITALLVAAILVLALFATISFDVSGGVKRYNSFISKIPLGSDLSGNATTILYPEGVLSDPDYSYVTGDDDESNAEKRDKYKETYVSRGSLWVDKEKIGDDDGKAFAESVSRDAAIISDRLSEKGYTSYSVAVVDGYSIRVTVPTGFSYAAMKDFDSNEQTTALAAAGHTVNYVISAGKLSLRDSNSKSVLRSTEELGDYIESASLYKMGGMSALKLKLTADGLERLNAVLTAEGASGSAYLYVGETNFQLTFTFGTALTERNLYFQADEGYSEDYAVTINSIVHGNEITNVYNNSPKSSSSDLVAVTPESGELSAIWLGVAVLATVVAVIVFSVIKYRWLGVVHSLMVLTYTFAMITAILLVGVQLTAAGAVTAVLGLALLSACNIFVFETVKNETALGRTIASSVKLGYKKCLFGVLDAHIILLIAAVLMTLVGAGEISACGLIFLIGVIASYVLHWFTRFMWYVLSSPARNKSGFCGFKKKEAEENE